MRKCIVTIPAGIRKIYIGGKEQGTELRPTEEIHNAVFHKWIDDILPVNENIIANVNKKGFFHLIQMALVEYEDGTVHKVEPEYIRFVDGEES